MFVAALLFSTAVLGFNGTYYHNYVDETGTTRITQCQFTSFKIGQIERGVIPVKTIVGIPDPAYGNFDFPTLKSPWGNVTVTETAVWVYPSDYGVYGPDKPWHTDPRPHMLWFIGGVGEWKTMSGDKVKLHPGDLLLSDDHATPDGRGHQARSISDVDLVHLNWELNAPSTIGHPCWLH